jgi:flagellar protein FliJ
MAKFVFQLEGVLRHRTNIEHQRKRELAVIQSQMTALDAELRALDLSVRSSETDLRTNRLLGKIDTAFLGAYRRYSIAMQRKAMGIAQKMGAIQVQIDQAKKNLAEAAKRKKVLEKLRERQLERWREQAARRDAAEMDEIGSQIGFDLSASADGSHMNTGAA